MAAPIRDAFGTLQDCVDAVRKDHPTGPGQPQILYRGEASVYPHTHSLIFRLTQELQVIPQNQIPYLMATLAEIQLKLDLVINEVPVFATPEAALAAAGKANPSNPIEILGAFLQHYYLPTPLLDVTDDLQTALAFAAYPINGKPEDQPNPGRLYVFDTAELLKAGRLVFSLLKSKARRPSTQRGY